MLELLLRGLYFYCVGLWLGGIWIVLSWLACLTIVGIPVGVSMISLVPQIMTLQPEGEWRTVEVGGRVGWALTEAEQPGFLVRTLWFVLVGWWASILWAKVAFILAATVIGLPFAFWMFNRLPWVMSLHRA